MADDATRVRLEGEDASGPAFDSVKGRLKDLEREARKTSDKLAGPASAFDELGKGIEKGLGQGLRTAVAGMGPVARAAVSAIIPLGVAAMGATAGLGAMAIAFREGTKENAEFVRVLASSNNAIGATANQLASMASEVDAIVGTHREAAAAIAQMAGSGLVARENLVQFSATAIELERTVGVSVKETAKNFEALGKAPLEASVKLNEAHRHLTLEVYNQIKALSEQGREAEAAALAQQTYNDALRRVADEVESTLGPFQRAWRGVKEVAKEAWDAMLGIGREGQFREQLDAARKRLEMMSPGGSGFGRFAQEEIDRQKELVRFLEARVATTEGLAAASSEWTKRQQAGVDAQRENAKWAEAALTRQQKMNRALEEYRRNNEKIRAAGGVIDPAQVAREEAAIRERFKERGKRDRVSEVERYLLALNKQLEKTAELTVYEQLLADVEAVRLGKVSDSQLEQLTSLARVIDARKEEAAEAEKRAALDKVIEAAQQREIDRNAKLIEQMEERVNKWLDELDPMREFIRHIEDVDRVVAALQAKGWVFTPEQIASIKELGNGLKDETKKVDDVARSLGLTFQSAFEDAIIEGKKFSSVLDGIAKYILRLTIRKSITEPAANWLSKTLNLAGLFGGGKASGGPVSAGTSYLVGERGPELFTPSTSGNITPNHAMGGITIHSVVNAAPGTNPAQLKAYLDQRDAQLKADLIDGMRRGRYPVPA